MTILLSKELRAIRDRLFSHSMTGNALTVLEQREIAAHLQGLELLAGNQEEELSVFRLQEVSLRGRQCVEQLAADAMGNMILGTDKVIRPDFGGRK